MSVKVGTLSFLPAEFGGGVGFRLGVPIYPLTSFCSQGESKWEFGYTAYHGYTVKGHIRDALLLVKLTRRIFQ